MKQSWKGAIAGIGFLFGVLTMPNVAEAASYSIPSMGHVETGAAMELVDLGQPEWGKAFYAQLEKAWPKVNQEVIKQLHLVGPTTPIGIPKIYQLKGSDEKGRHIGWLLVTTISKEAARKDSDGKGFLTDDMFDTKLSPETVKKYRSLPKTAEDKQQEVDRYTKELSNMSVTIRGYDRMQRFYTGQEFIWQESSRVVLTQQGYVLPLGITDYLLDRGDSYVVAIVVSPDTSYTFFKGEVERMMMSVRR